MNSYPPMPSPMMVADMSEKQAFAPPSSRHYLPTTVSWNDNYKMEHEIQKDSRRWEDLDPIKISPASLGLVKNEKEAYPAAYTAGSPTNASKPFFHRMDSGKNFQQYDVSRDDTVDSLTTWQEQQAQKTQQMVAQKQQQMLAQQQAQQRLQAAQVAHQQSHVPQHLDERNRWNAGVNTNNYHQSASNSPYLHNLENMNNDNLQGVRWANNNGTHDSMSRNCDGMPNNENCPNMRWSGSNSTSLASTPENIIRNNDNGVMSHERNYNTNAINAKHEMQQKHENWNQSAGNYSMSTMAPQKSEMASENRSNVGSTTTGFTNGMTRSTGTGRSDKKFLCKFIIGISADDPDFNVRQKVIGKGGKHMLRIASRGEGVRLRLRGQGSGYKEPLTNEESKDPLQLCLSVPGSSPATFELAKRSVTKLLQEAYTEYHSITGKKVEVIVLEHPSNPK
jgi:hypothetical protein